MTKFFTIWNLLPNDHLIKHLVDNFAYYLHEFSSQNPFSLHTFIEFRHTISTLNVLQMHSQTTTTKTHRKLEYKNPKHVIINSKKHKIPINPKITSINLKHFKFECLIIHTPLLASLEQCFRMF